MKPLKDIVKNISVNESFKSRELGEVLKGNKNLRLNNLGGWSYELQWDKISDDDINKVYSKDEALRIMRSRKDGARYVLWATKKSGYSYREEKYGDIYIYAITVGMDVAFWDGSWRNRPESTLGCVESYSFNFAIEVLDWEKFMTKELRKQRREARDGALALRDAQEIAIENVRRYKETLQDMRNKNELLPIRSMFEDAINAYKETANIWLDMWADCSQTGNRSYYEVARNWHTMNKAVETLIDRMHSVSEYANNTFWVDSVKRYIDEVKTSAQAIQDLAQKARDAQN